MKSTVIILLFVLCSINIFASDIEIEYGNISGTIVDENSNNPIPYASVALVTEPDSTLITGVMTNNIGVYELTNVPFGQYNIKVSFIGYESKVIENIEVTKKAKKVDLGKIMLKESFTSLDEAVITHERIKGEEKIDRTVFTINDDLRNSSSSGLDMLKHIPSVSVDFQENVTVEGSTNIQFYVDGVLRNKDYIAQIDPTLIDKIEVISNPGVKYDADLAAVLNIVLKKEKRYGFSGLAKIEVPNPNVLITSPRASLEFGTQRFRIYVADRLHYESFTGSQTFSMLQNLENGDVLSQTKNGAGDNTWSNNHLNYGIDFFISDKTSINFYGDKSSHLSITDDFVFDTKVHRNDILENYMQITQNNRNNGVSNYYSLYGKHKFDEDGSELTLEGNYYTYHSEEKDTYDDVYYDIVDFIPDYEVNREELNLNNRQSLEFKSNLAIVNEDLKHEIGYQLYDQWIDNSFENSGSSLIEYFNYNELRHAAYYSLLGKFNKFTYQLGARGEISYINIEEQKEIKYGAFVPSFSVNYQLPNSQSLKFAYNRRIDRPSIGNLNPFERYYDSLHVRSGNPDLKPSYSNKFELSYTANIKNNYFGPKLYATHTKNGFQELKYIREDGLVEYRTDNVGEAWEYGGAVSFAWQITDWLRLNGYTRVFNQIYYSDHEFTLTDKKQKVNYEGNATTIVKLPKDFVLFAMIQKNRNQITYTEEFTRDALFLFGGEKEIIKNGKLEVVYVPFNKNFTYSAVTTQSEGLYENWSGDLYLNHAFIVSFTYRFNYGKKVNKINRSTDYQKDNGGGGL